MYKNAAVISISEEVLLDLLHLKGGTIHSVYKEKEFGSDVISFVIEHPDLPEVEAGNKPFHIAPSYTHYNEIINGKKYTRIEHIDPPEKDV